VRRRVQPITLSDVVHPVRSPVGQPVFVGQLAELGQLVQHLAKRIVRVLDEQLTQFAEVVLEPTRVMISMMRPGSLPAFHMGASARAVW
jgi:hypothetical protein